MHSWFPIDAPRDELQVRPRRIFARQVLALAAAISLPSDLYSETKARRIVSTAPSITEVLFSLGLGEQVVGVSRYCNFPPQAVKLPKVGSYLQPDLESIARLAPDLVVLQNSPAEFTDRLKSIGVAYVQVPHGTLEDVFSGIGIIAQAAGVPDRGVSLIARIKNALQSIQTKARTTPAVSVVLIIDRKQGTLTNLIATGPDNYLNQLLEIAGARNVIAKPGLTHYPHISLETIIRENPDFILDLSGTGDTEAERQASSPDVIALWAQNTSLNAVRSGHIYFGASNALVVPGPRAPEAAQILFDYLHGNVRRGEVHG